MNKVQTIYDNAFAKIASVRDSFTPQLTLGEVGTVTSVATGIAKVSGLPGVGFDELVTFPGGVLGIAFNVDADEIGVGLHRRGRDRRQRPAGPRLHRSLRRD